MSTTRRRRGVRVFAWAYLSVVATWLLVHLVFGDATWWLFLVNSQAHLLVLPAPVVAILAWWTGPVHLRLAAVLVVVMAWSSAGPTWARTPTVDASLHHVRVATWNLHQDNADVTGVLDTLRQVDADLIALHELNPVIADAISTELSDVYPHRVVFPAWEWDGVGVVSRYPLRWDEKGIPGASVRNPLIVEAELPGGPTTLIVAHFASTPRYLAGIPHEIDDAMRLRSRRSREIVDLVSTRDQPILLLGDLNMTARNDPYRTLAGALEDAWSVAGRGFGFTYPGGARRPSLLGIPVPQWFLRIDYVFSSGEWRAQRAWVGPWDGSSDHRPVVVGYERSTPGDLAPGRASRTSRTP